MPVETQQHPRALHNDLIEDMAARRTQAHTEISKLCSGERHWTMSIPVQMTDSDHVLHYALEDAMVLEREVYRLRGMVKVIAANMDMPDDVRQALHAILFGTGVENA